MGKVVLDMAVSLDGFIAGPNGEDWGLHDYFFSPSRETLEVLEQGFQTTGAIIMGRRSYDLGAQQDGFVNSPYQAANFVLTHHVPAKVAKGAESFVFVTEGIQSALRQARAAAGYRDVVIGGGAHTAQQFLKAGLLEQIQLHLVPKLLGRGIRLFEGLEGGLSELEPIAVIAAPEVTHLSFRVGS